MADTAVQIQRLTKSFPLRKGWAEALAHPFRRDTVTATSDVTLDVPAGSCYGILGPNGAGKSTIFRMLATLVLPDEGTARIKGWDLRQNPARVRQSLALVVPNERSLYWRLTARENLRLYAALQGLPRRTRNDRIAELIGLVGLTEVADRMVGPFSSGMKQRLLIARALLSRPSVLLLDEPTRSLDPVAARVFRSFVRQDIIEGQRCTVLLATHDAEEVADLSDHVAILHHGRVLDHGPVGQVMERYAEERYRAWTTDPDNPVWAPLAPRRVPGGDGTDSEWQPLEFVLPEGAEDPAEVLRHLVSAGVRVSRFERVPLRLSSLLERAIARKPSPLPDA